MNEKQKRSRQLISIVLTIALTLSCVPVDSYATERVEKTECTHHESHTEECGYETDEVCSFVCEECTEGENTEEQVQDAQTQEETVVENVAEEPAEEIQDEPEEEVKETPEEEVEEETSEEDIISVEIIDLDEDIIGGESGLSVVGVDDGTVDLEDGNHEKWIDRVDLPEYARNWYDTLVEASDNDGDADFLISDEYFSEDNAKTARMSGVVHKVNVIVVASFSNPDDATVNYARNCIKAARDAFVRDHPEVFWLMSSTLLLTMNVGSGEKEIWFVLKDHTDGDDFDIRETKYADEETIKSAIETRDNAVANILSTVTASSAAEQIRQMNNWLTTHNEYNIDVAAGTESDNVDIRRCISALTGRTGQEGPVCEGYAEALKVLCDQRGIPCVLVDGTNHMWNYVQVNGNWYGVDVTWNDPTTGEGAFSGYESETWLLLGSDTIVSGKTFLGHHPVKNQVSTNRTAFTNGPELATDRYPAYTVVFNGTNVTSNGANPAYTGQEYVAVLTAEKGYLLPETIVVTVGGTALTADTGYTYVNGTITIPAENVNGEIVITAEGTACPHDSNRTYTAPGGGVIQLTCEACGTVFGTVTLNAPSQLTYDGTAKAATVDQTGEVTFDGPITYEEQDGDGWKELDEAPINAGTYKASITLEEVTASVEYTITKASLEAAVVTVDDTADLSYTGSEIKPNVTVTLDGQDLDAADYEISYSDNINAGTATVTVTGKGNYAGTTTATFEIKPQKVLNYDILTSDESFTYDGAKKEYSTITVKDGEVEIPSGEYTVSYANNVNAGKASITIKDAADGNYEISDKTIEFDIQKLAITITAENQEMAVNTTVPDFTYQIMSGALAEGDRFSTEPQLSSTADGTVGGTYDITVSGAVIVNEAGVSVTDSYEITYTAGELTVKVHVHAWTYSVDEVNDKITATCNATGCQVETVTITVTEPTELQYDGNAKEVTVTQNPENTFEDITVVYSGETLEENGTAIKPGDYTATVSIGEESNKAQVSVEFTIDAPKFSDIAITAGTGTWTNKEEGETPLFSISADAYTEISSKSAEMFVSTDDGANWETVTLTENGNVYESTKTVQDILGNNVGDVEFKVKLTADNYEDWISEKCIAAISALELDKNAAVFTSQDLNESSGSDPAVAYYTGMAQTPALNMEVKKENVSVYNTTSAAQDGMVTFTYSNNTEVGTATVTVTGNGTQITGSTTFNFSIAYYVTDKTATASRADWAQYVTVHAPEGFMISQTIDGQYAESFEITQQSAATEGTEVTYYLKTDANGYITEAKKLTVKVDTSAPQFTGENGIKITDRDAWWQRLLTTITFGAYKPQQVTVRAEDTLSGVKEYYYYIDASENTAVKTAEELAACKFEKSEDGTFGLETDGSYVIYAYAVDNAGNRSDYTSSEGIIIDGTAPTVTITADADTTVDAASEKAVNIGINEAATYFYAVHKTAENKTYEDINSFATEAAGVWNAKEGVVKDSTDGADEKSVLFDNLTPNTEYVVSAIAVDSVGNVSQVVTDTFTTTKAMPVFENLPAALNGVYGDSIDSILASLPTSSQNGVEGTWSVQESGVLNVGRHTLTVTFTPDDEAKYGSYSYTITVDISQKDISNDAAVTIDGTFEYNGSAQTPDPVVKIGETTLVQGNDYTVTYDNNTDAGTATVTVNGTGNYTGTKSAEFVINKVKLLNISNVLFADGTFSPTKEYDATTAMSEIEKVKFSLNDSVTEWFTVDGNMTAEAEYNDANEGANKAYSVTVSLGEELSKNYELQIAEADFYNGIITAAPITIKADDKLIFVNDAVPAYTYTVEGLKGDDTAETVVGNVVYSTNETVDTSKVGTYTISISAATLSSSNYVLDATTPYKTGTLTVVTHQHDWTYTANDTNNTITAKCNGTIGTCPNDEVVITLVAPTDRIYNGTEKSATVSMSKETDAFGTITPTYTGEKITDGKAINAGSYRAAIEVGGKSVSVDFAITAKPLTDASVVVADTYTYDGSVIVPNVTVTVDGETLIKDTDFTVAGSSKNAGSATVTVTGKGNYSGSASETFEILRRPVTVNANTVTKVYGAKDPVLTYSVDESTPLVTGDVLAGTLQRGAGENTGNYEITQGTLTNDNNANYDITFVGAQFTITAKTIQNPVITLSQNSFEYSGSAHEPSVTVKDGTTALVAGSDYTVSYENNTAVGTAKAVITLNADGSYTYEGELTSEFTITKKKLTVSSATATSKEYDGTTSVAVTAVKLIGAIPNEEVSVDTAQIVAELAKADAGNYTSVTISNLVLQGAQSSNYELTGGTNGKYTVDTKVAIQAKSITMAVVTVADGEYIYKGAEIQPKVTVALGGKTLVEGTDYTVAYTNNINAGQATVTVTGCGNYKDSVNGSFVIAPAKLTVTAEDKIASVGDDAPALTYKVSGLVKGEQLTKDPTLAYAATPDMTQTGTCTIVASGAEAGSNYTIQYVNGTLYIMAADVDEILIEAIQSELTEATGELSSIPELDTPDKIKQKLTRALLSGTSGYTEDNIAHYEVTVKYSLDGGESWNEATEDNFSQGGIRVKLNYPEGTGKNTHDFVVIHMFAETSDKLGTIAGETELPKVKKLDDGLEVVLNGLSPVSIAWKEIPKDSSSDGGSNDSEKSEGPTLVEVSHPVVSQGATQSTGTATGDGSYAEWYIVTLLLAGAGVLSILMTKRKKAE